MFTLHFHAGKLKSVTSWFFVSFNDQLLLYIPSLIKSKKCLCMYVLYVSLENLLHSDIKLLSLKIITVRNPMGLKHLNFILRGWLLLKFKTVQIFKQLNQYAFKSSKFRSKLQVLQSRSLESQDLRSGWVARYGMEEWKEGDLMSQLFDFNSN